MGTRHSSAVTLYPGQGLVYFELALCTSVGIKQHVSVQSKPLIQVGVRAVTEAVDNRNYWMRGAALLAKQLRATDRLVSCARNAPRCPSAGLFSAAVASQAFRPDLDDAGQCFGRQWRAWPWAGCAAIAAAAALSVATAGVGWCDAEHETPRERMQLDMLREWLTENGADVEALDFKAIEVRRHGGAITASARCSVWHRAR